MIKEGCIHSGQHKSPTKLFNIDISVSLKPSRVFDGVGETSCNFLCDIVLLISSSVTSLFCFWLEPLLTLLTTTSVALSETVSTVVFFVCWFPKYFLFLLCPFRCIFHTIRFITSRFHHLFRFFHRSSTTNNSITQSSFCCFLLSYGITS